MWSRTSSHPWRTIKMESDLDKYVKEIRRIGGDLERALRAAAQDLDRLGREALTEAAMNAKQGGKEAEQALLRLERDLREGGPNIRRGMEELQRRMNEAAAKLEEELKRPSK